MKWRGKEIKELDDGQLAQANVHIQKLIDDYNEISKTAKFQKKFENQPVPKMNPVLSQLQTEIKSELKSREK